jgi:hypothetical protein
MTDYEAAPADSPYHRTLPIGEQLSARPLIDDALSCFDDVTLKALAPMLVPEKPRAGELDRAECGHCRPSAASRRGSTSVSRTRRSSC